jgi:hypothetical protein
MDLSMPIMDGAERRPGGCGRSASPPIVALTAMPAERQPLQVLGFNGCLTKLVRAAMPRAATARILSSSAYLCMSSRERSKAGRTSLGQIRVPARYLLVPDTLELQDDALFHLHDVPVGHGAAAAPRRQQVRRPGRSPLRRSGAGASHAGRYALRLGIDLRRFSELRQGRAALPCRFSPAAIRQDHGLGLLPERARRKARAEPAPRRLGCPFSG